MPGYVLGAIAQRDLDEIWDYSRKESGDQVAEQHMVRILNSIDLLSAYPHMGNQRPEYALGIRSHMALNSPYMILYVPIGDQQIEVVRVLRGSQDIQRFFDALDC